MGFYLLQIIHRANELGEDPLELSRRFCREFHVDMASLQCLPPSMEPRVTDHIPQIVKMILQVSSLKPFMWPGRYEFSVADR